jgi:hypothetical protein
MDLRCSQLIPAEDEADLWAVAMCHNHIPPALDHVGDVLAGLFNRAHLRIHILVLFVQDQGVAADRDDGDAQVCIEIVMRSLLTPWSGP